ncbi:hypothetical protein SLA2020_506210 [Shorea laevis]
MMELDVGLMVMGNIGWVKSWYRLRIRYIARNSHTSKKTKAIYGLLMERSEMTAKEPVRTEIVLRISLHRRVRKLELALWKPTSAASAMVHNIIITQ